MRFSYDFKPLSLEDVHSEAQRRFNGGWRYVQMLAVNRDNGADVVYSFMKDGELDNLIVSDVPRQGHIQSITDLYLEAFVCENEICDLFGIKFDDLKIDFLGNFYKLSSEYPMTIISPEQLAEREKQKKIAAAKAAKEAKGSSAGGKGAPDVDLEAKLAGMDPEKAAKVRAAMKAKADKELEEKLAGMDPEKAAKVRAAMEAKAKKETEQKGSEE